MSFHHVSVLLDEATALLDPARGGLFVDCTLGGGGHSEALLSASDSVQVLGLDRDPSALAAAGERLARFGERFTALRGSFGDLGQLLDQRGISRVAGILADVGVSSPQLDTAERGFSFSKDGPLDMRMDPEGPTTAADLVNELPVEELARIFYEYGEEHQSRRLARAVVAARPLTRTAELARVIAGVLGRGDRRVHPATRSFQALRIAVNDELGQLERLLEQLPTRLAGGGRAVIISFHSLEDRLVKRRFRAWAGLDAEKDAYGVALSKPIAELLTRKALTSSDDNPRARSAKMRGLSFF